MVGVATVGSPTVKLKEVVFVTLLPAAVTVMVDVPAGVEALVLIFRVVEQVVLHEAAENEAMAPTGRPETLKETTWVAPGLEDAVIVSEAEEPAITETLPELESEKSKVCPRVNQALATALAVKLFLNAFALTIVLTDSENGCEYRGEFRVGELPSVV